MASSAASGSSYPHPNGPEAAPTAASFATDPRVHFDQRSGKWTYEAPDGREFEWEITRGVWVPVLEDALVTAQQTAYSVAGVDESTPVGAVLAREAKKRKADDDPSAPKKAKRPPKNTAPRQTAIYVTHLPQSTTPILLASVFSKAGLILEDADGEPKIKLYKDDEGRFKGEALVVYLKEESVELATRLFDETELVLGSGEGEMRVKKAEWEKKAGGEENGEEGKKLNGGKKDQEKQKAGRRAEKLKKKLTDWDSDDEDAATIAARAKYSRLVVLQGMFTLKELEDDATLLLDLKEDVREECETLGEVTNVTLYDREDDGIMTVRFKEEAPAQACIAKMDGRFFGGRSIAAFLFDGSRKYRKSGQSVSLAGTGMGDDGEDVEEKEHERLEKYAQWLEEDGKKE